jgi:hypothetical protein
MMKRGSVFSGVLAVALWATLGTAEAKLVRYEINGQRYSYSTNNRQQVREAQQRIQAAQEAATATAQAAAERAANPLVRLFGSPTSHGQSGVHCPVPGSDPARSRSRPDRQEALPRDDCHRECVEDSGVHRRVPRRT